MFTCWPLVGMVPSRHLVDYRNWLHFHEHISMYFDRTIRRLGKWEELGGLDLVRRRSNGDIRAHVATKCRFDDKSVRSRANSVRRSSISSDQCWKSDPHHKCDQMIVHWCKCGSFRIPASSERTQVQVRLVDTANFGCALIPLHCSCLLEWNQPTMLGSLHRSMECSDHWRPMQWIKKRVRIELKYLRED